MRRLPFPRAGLLAAFLALAVQLGFAASVPNPASAFLLAASGPICHGPDRPVTPARHPAPDAALCPLCAALMAPAPILGAAPPVPLPVSVIVLHPVVLPSPTAPPAERPVGPQPRGPPFLA